MPILQDLNEFTERTIHYQYMLEHHFGLTTELSSIEYTKQHAAASADKAKIGVLPTIIDVINQSQEDDLDFIEYSQFPSSVLPFFYDEITEKMAMTSCLNIINESPIFSDIEKRALKKLVDEKKLQIFALSASEKANIGVKGKLFSRSSELFCIDLYFIGNTFEQSRVGHAVTLAEELCHLLFQAAHANNTNPYDKNEVSRLAFEELLCEDWATIEKKSNAGLLNASEKKLTEKIYEMWGRLPKSNGNAEISAKLCALLADIESNVQKLFPVTITYCKQQMVLGAKKIITSSSIQSLSNQAHCENKPPLSVFSTTRTYSASEQETIIAALKYPVTEPSVIKVSHGTGESQVSSIQAGVKNMGGGFGGTGLYLDTSHDSSLAEHHAIKAKTYYIDEEGVRQLKRGAVMSGELKLTPETKRAKIVIAHRCRQSDVNIARGIFPANWAKSPALQQLVHSNFDVLVVQGAETAGYGPTSDNFLVALESENKNMLTWNAEVKYPNKTFSASCADIAQVTGEKAPPTGLPRPVQQPVTQSNAAKPPAIIAGSQLANCAGIAQVTNTPSMPIPSKLEVKVNPKHNSNIGAAARRIMPKTNFTGVTSLDDKTYLFDKPRRFRRQAKRLNYSKKVRKTQVKIRPKFGGVMSAINFVIATVHEHRDYPNTPFSSTALIAVAKVARNIALFKYATSYRVVTLHAHMSEAIHQSLANLEASKQSYSYRTPEMYARLLEADDCNFRAINILVDRYKAGNTAEGNAYMDRTFANVEKLTIGLKLLFDKSACKEIVAIDDFLHGNINAICRFILNPLDIRGFKKLYSKTAQITASNALTHTLSLEPLDTTPDALKPQGFKIFNPLAPEPMAPQPASLDSLMRSEALALLHHYGTQPMAAPTQQSTVDKIKSTLGIKSLEVRATHDGGISVLLNPVGKDFSIGLGASDNGREFKIEYNWEFDPNNPSESIVAGLVYLIYLGLDKIQKNRQKKVIPTLNTNKSLTREMLLQLEKDIIALNNPDLAKSDGLDRVKKLSKNIEQEHLNLLARLAYAIKHKHNDEAAHYLKAINYLNRQGIACKNTVTHCEENNKQQQYLEKYTRCDLTTVIAKMESLTNNDALSREDALKYAVLQGIVVQQAPSLSASQRKKLESLNNSFVVIPVIRLHDIQHLSATFIKFNFFDKRRSDQEKYIKQSMENINSQVLALSECLKSKKKSANFDALYEHCNESIKSLVKQLKKIKITLPDCNNAYEYYAEVLQQRQEAINKIKELTENTQPTESKHGVVSIEALQKSIGDQIRRYRRYQEQILLCRPLGSLLHHVLHHATTTNNDSLILDTGNVLINQAPRFVPGLYTSIATIPTALIHGELPLLSQQFGNNAARQLHKLNNPFTSVNRVFQSASLATGFSTSVLGVTEWSKKNPKTMNALHQGTFFLSKFANLVQVVKHVSKGKGALTPINYLSEIVPELGFSVYETMHSEVQLPENYSDYTLSNAYAAAVIRIFGNEPGTQPMDIDYYRNKSGAGFLLGLGAATLSAGVVGFLGWNLGMIAIAIYNEKTGNDKQDQISALKAALANHYYHTKNKNTKELDAIIMAIEKVLPQFKVTEDHSQISLVNHCRTLTMDYNLKKVLNSLEDKAKILHITSYSHVNNCFYFTKNNLSVSHRPDFLFIRLSRRLVDQEALKALFSLENLKSDQNIYQDFWLALYAVLENEDTFTNNRDELQTAYQNIKSFAEIIRDHHFNTLRSRVEPIDGEIEYYSNLSLATVIVPKNN